MKKDKITIEHMKEVFSNIPYGTEFTRPEIRKMVTDKYGNMEVIPSDFCYNRYNKDVNLEKNLREHRCLFEYIARNRYKYIGTGQLYSGNIYHQPKGSLEYVIGRINNGVVVEWYK